MTIALWCVLIAGLLPYLAIGIAKFDKSYLRHNHDPRAWEAGLTGMQARAHNAHLNAFEAFPLFAAGVIVATLQKAPPAVVDAIAVAFVLVRLAYLVCYLTNQATLRSLAWLAGFGLAIALYVVAAGAS
ncbi:MAG TPA: MAPEG family protein [Usitatibacteraceae bacterium]|nr:MAPEG family protein [Usitatibacteraceae bacterium]